VGGGRQRSVRGHRDFSRLWTGQAISQLGSAVGMVGLPVVAVTVVRASAFQVSVLTALTAVTTALLALPMGSHVEFRRKRPVLVAADLVRFASLVSIPLAAWLGGLGYTHLCAVAVINAACQIAFTAAAQAHLKALVSPEALVDANSRLESTVWLSLSIGPSLAGVLIGFVSALGALVVDAVSFLFSAAAVTRLRTPEPVPPLRRAGTSRRADLVGGLRFVWGHPVLRRCLVSWVLFAGTVMMASPLSTVFYLRTLHFTPWQYGLLMGLPSLGGFFGSRLTRRVVSRLGAVRTLWGASLLRGPWQLLIPLAVPGPLGLAMCGVAIFGVLFFAGMANSAMSAYRQSQTPDHLMARVSTLWSFASTVAQPAFILVGGLVAAWVGTRMALLVAAVLMCASALLLPQSDRAASMVGSAS
jgi:predicted MFS family arabinose efflux permease